MLWIIPSTLATNTEHVTRFGALTSYLLDGFTAYVTSSLGYMIGLVSNRLSPSLFLIRRDFKLYLSRAFLAVTVSVLIAALALSTGANNQSLLWTGLTAMNLFICSSMGISQSYRTYKLFAVMDKDERREFRAKRADDTAIRSALRALLPIRNPLRSSLTPVFALITLFFGLVPSFHMTGQLQGIGPVAAGVMTASFTFVAGLLGVIHRTVADISPYRQGMSLVPVWELRHFTERKRQVDRDEMDRETR